MAPSWWEAETMSRVPMDGMLVVAQDASQITRRTTVGGRAYRSERPRLWISEAVAERLLRESGYSLEALRSRCETLGAEQVFGLSAEAAGPGWRSRQPGACGSPSSWRRQQGGWVPGPCAPVKRSI